MTLTLMSLVSVSLLGQVGTASTAQTGGSCAAQTTSRLDSLLHPTTGSDERFFSRPNGAPNVLMVFDTSADTIGWQTAFPSSGECSDADFMKDYDGTKSYEPGVAKADATGWPANAGDYYDKYFEKNKVYVAPSNGNFGLSLGGMGGPTQPAGWPKADVTAACALTGGDDSDCANCLNNKGYYRGTVDGVAGRVISIGNALNYAPPRYLALFQVGSQLVRDVQNARLGIIVSQPWKNSEKWGGAGAVQDICFPFYFWPSCNKAYDSGKKFSDSDTVSQRNSILGSAGWGSLSAAGFAGPNLTGALLYSAGIALTNKGGTTANAFPSSATWPTSGKFEEKNGPNQKSWCDACVYSAVIYVNASFVDVDFINPNRDLGGLTIPAFASTIGGSPASTCDSTAMPNRCMSKADEIAAWLYRQDFRGDLGGTQRISTYVVDMSGGSATGDLMRSIAKQGGGRYFSARNNVKLKAAVLEALDDISNRGQTFATSAVTSIQTGSLQLTQMVPRMYPQRGLPWSGELYRYAQKNEFVDEVDLNGDGDRVDVFAVDKDGDPVVETGDGFFMKAYSFADLTPIGGTQSDGGVAALLDGGVGTAKPFWEAAAALRTKGWQNRVIWTVVDRDDGRGSFTHEDGYVRFRKSNWQQLGPLMGLHHDNCPSSTTEDGDILEALNLSQSNAATLLGMSMPGSAYERWELCVKTVIDYTRGRDLGDEDGDGNRDEDRASMMADIFHSSPIVVEPPPERFVCDLGLSNQCGRTLYAANLPGGATPLDQSYTFNDNTTCNVNRTDPYEIYRAKHRARDKVVVVGSNGGMLHVFNNGTLKTTPAPTCSGIAWSGEWDEGTGEEHWAFVPPTLVPKLQDQIVRGHEYFVDADVMVRDVWVDGSGDASKPGCVANADGKKQWCEFHTMLVGAEGRGGQHYFALELMWDDTDDGTNSASRRAIMDPSVSKPFRWVFPQPGTETSARFGKTLFTLTPKPPPIGPVILADTRNGPVNRYGVDTREAWVVMVGGGWASGLHKGRGVYMIDAYWGLINGREDNLYWSAEIDDGASSNTRAPLASMSGSVVAPVAMVDYGRNEAPTADGFFDTAVVADTVGQLWVARFWDPGVVTTDPSDAVSSSESFPGGAARAPWTDRASPGLIQNWFMARAFEQDKGAPASSSDQKGIVNVQPFHYLPSVAIEPATLAMRAFVGSGNRYALLEEYSGKCRWDNPMACAKYGCDDINIGLHSRKSPDEINRMRNQWDDLAMKWSSGDRYDEGSDDHDYCDDNNAHYHEYHIKDCDQASGGNVDYDDVNNARIDCSTSIGDYGYACENSTPDEDRRLRDLDFKIKTSLADATGKDRYYGIWVYGGDRVFVADGGAPTPKTFDDNRFTDRGGGAGTGDLVNVTATTCTYAGNCTGSVGTGNRGWFYEYANHGMKTATGSAILASCALWSSLNPAGDVAGGTQACTTGVATSTFFQGDFITGEPNCAVGFQNPDGGANFRGMERGVLTPPPEPATVVQISKSGQIRYSAQLPEPGKGQQLQIDVTVGGDLMQSVYTLPVSRSTHDCRHNQGGNCVPVP